MLLDNNQKRGYCYNCIQTGGGFVYCRADMGETQEGCRLNNELFQPYSTTYEWIDIDENSEESSESITPEEQFIWDYSLNYFINMQDDPNSIPNFDIKSICLIKYEDGSFDIEASRFSEEEANEGVCDGFIELPDELINRLD